MDADYDNVCLKDQDRAVDFNDNDEVSRLVVSDFSGTINLNTFA